MKKIFSLTMVRDMFEMLANNEYNLAWELIEDFEINGHIVSVKNSRQLNNVIIDNRYVSIGGACIIQYKGKAYQPIDYAMMLLERCNR